MASSAFKALLEQEERYKRMLRPAWMDMHEQMEKALAPLRQNIEMMERIKIDMPAFRMNELSETHRSLIDIAEKAKENFRWAEDIGKAHLTWMESTRPLQDSLAILNASICPSLAEITRYTSASEKLLAGIDFSTLHLTYSLPESLVLSTYNSFKKLTQSYERLVGSIKTFPELIELPAYTLPGASREIFTAGYAISRICPVTIESEDEEYDVTLAVETEQEVSISLELLRRVDPALEKPYIGARDALHGNNTDRTRHILISLRELWGNLLRKLAPDKKVWHWIDSQGDRKQMIKNGELLYIKDGKEHLTRGARVRFICQPLENELFTDFIVHDTRALIKLIDLFQRVHELDPELTDVQLRALLLRTDSWLLYILNIWREGE